MKVCFPVQTDNGLESRVYGHFGSAPMFVVVDLANDSISTIINSDQHHQHGSCNPIRALDNHKVDAIVVGGIGGGALNRLNQSGIRVFRAGAPLVKENVDLFLTARLPEYTLSQCCGGHGETGGCSH